MIVKTPFPDSSVQNAVENFTPVCYHPGQRSCCHRSVPSVRELFLGKQFLPRPPVAAQTNFFRRLCSSFCYRDVRKCSRGRQVWFDYHSIRHGHFCCSLPAVRFCVPCGRRLSRLRVRLHAAPCTPTISSNIAVGILPTLSPWIRTGTSFRSRVALCAVHLPHQPCITTRAVCLSRRLNCRHRQSMQHARSY